MRIPETDGGTGIGGGRLDARRGIDAVRAPVVTHGHPVSSSDRNISRQTALELKDGPRPTEDRIMTTQTHEAPPTTRRRATRKAAVLAGLVAVVVMALGACSPEENRGLELVNQSRASAGLPGLPLNIDLYFKAQGWSQQLAGSQSLRHSNLAEGNGYRWCRLGENVGYGYSMEQVHNAFMNSSGHRANILDRSFNRVGVGVTRDGGGRYWVVQEFMQEC